MGQQRRRVVGAVPSLDDRLILGGEGTPQIHLIPVSVSLLHSEATKFFPNQVYSSQWCSPEQSASLLQI
jgi:hypothetical protein